MLGFLLQYLFHMNMTSPRLFSGMILDLFFCQWLLHLISDTDTTFYFISESLKNIEWTRNRQNFLNLLGEHFHIYMFCPVSFPYRIWSHGTTVKCREGLLHHLLGDWHPLHLTLPYGCGAKDHGVQHAEADHVHPQALGPVQATGGHRSCQCARHICHLLLLSHPRRHLLSAGGELELPGVLLLLLHFPQHHRPGWLRTRRGPESEVQGVLQSGHHWWGPTFLLIFMAKRWQQ